MNPVAASIAALATASVLAAAAPATPNVVLILADDLGWGSVGCYGADPGLVKTPAIDRLAREGRRFTDACTPSSVCSPTRYALLTGRYCWRSPLKHGVLSTADKLWIEPGRLTIASLLKQRGYRAAAIGKWHLGYGAERPVDFTRPLSPGPLDIGFDFHFGLPSNHGDVTGVYVLNDRVDGLRSGNLKPAGACYYGGKPFLGLDAPQRKDEDVMEVLTDKAIDWIGQGASGKPFFLYFAPVAVHEPVTPSAATKGRSKAGPYGDWIHELDRSVGRILTAIDKNGLAADTLVLFTSDNGGENKRTRSDEQVAAIKAGLRMNGPWRAGKHSIYEGGFRVPYIVRWPGKVPAATVCDETISLVDTLATLAAVVDAPLPPPAKAAEDSHNLLPAWLGAKTGGPLHPSVIEHNSEGVFAVRSGPWKWIEGKASATNSPKGRLAECHPQLYQLQDDPAETRNLIDKHPEVARRLAAVLDQARERGFTRP